MPRCRVLLVGRATWHGRRYQLGAPTWRALVGVMHIELDGIRYVLEGDRTAVFVDARPTEGFEAGSLSRSRNIPLPEVLVTNDDGRLPMDDHNTHASWRSGATPSRRVWSPVSSPGTLSTTSPSSTEPLPSSLLDLASHYW
jgi:hypothetical protein